MRTLALGSILGVLVGRIVHARRVLADLLNLDGDPAARPCSSSWCPLDHSDTATCDTALDLFSGGTVMCDLVADHDGHHHDHDADVRWSRRWAA